MSVQPVTRYAAVCDSCSAVGKACSTEQCAHDTSVRAGWTNTSFGLFCTACQPCTECPHNSGPTADGRLCDACRAAVCARCGHKRREHMHFPNLVAQNGMPTRVCYLFTGEYVECGCPFEAPSAVSVDV